MNRHPLTLGILAHVDAGKTTLSESLLYHTGVIDSVGRVDHQNAFLDTFQLEKSRGITIFSKQAVMTLKDYQVTLLDTPGHVDFSAEMERTLAVLDYAVLVINGSDGIEGHTQTVWRLLKRYGVPTLIFVNKMDLPGTDQKSLIHECQQRLDDRCVAFADRTTSDFYDAVAMCDEKLMEAYLDQGIIKNDMIANGIARRHIFPVFFGSALKDIGVEVFIESLGEVLKAKSYPDIFGARVFKVLRDNDGNRLTYMKITGGALKVKSLISGQSVDVNDGDGRWEEKADQLRIYSGADYEMVHEVSAGTICAVTGLTKTRPGDGLGFEGDALSPMLRPVLSYEVILPESVNAFTMLRQLRMLEEEEPHLNVLWNEQLEQIHVQVMGEIQVEILGSTIEDRYGVKVEFGQGDLVYMETVGEEVIGRGHFEPLKHYAEVHLLIEPMPRGSGIHVGSDCSDDLLEGHWQRLIMTHLQERQHIGVLTGSVLTDVRITVVGGKGHNKHTEGGDFREATFRALRQGLMKTQNILLEPYYSYELEVPKEMLGRAMSDIERMFGQYDDPIMTEDQAKITGIGPVSTFRTYPVDVAAYTKGLGRITMTPSGYERCHNEQEVVGSVGYEPEQDVRHPAGSVFCSKGSGYSVSWQEADHKMHIDTFKYLEPKNEESVQSTVSKGGSLSQTVTDDELARIFEKTYGTSKREKRHSGSGYFDSVANRSRLQQQKEHLPKDDTEEAKYLLVDGYNIIFAWDELKSLVEENMDTARLRLMDLLCSYKGQTGQTVILVFDAYRVAGSVGDMTTYHNIHVVYTKEAETADQYIERLVSDIPGGSDITVATSDVLEQIIIIGKGARKLSAEGLHEEMQFMAKSMREAYKDKGDVKHRPFEGLL